MQAGIMNVIMLLGELTLNLLGSFASKCIKMLPYL